MLVAWTAIAVLSTIGWPRLRVIARRRRALSSSAWRIVGFDTTRGVVDTTCTGLKVDGRGKVAVASSDTHGDLAKLSIGKTGVSPEITDEGRRLAAEVLGHQFN